jgi:enhancing lycopene biosynthesis protein 2
MRVGVLLGGCGHYDGTDVGETVLTLLALEEEGEKPALFAPRRDQDRTIDHLTSDATAGEPRDMLRESARLWRGRVLGLDQVKPDHLEALIIPGGYGPVVNFSTGFARAGERRALLPEIETLVRHCLEQRKPIGCISLGEVPVLTVLGREIVMQPPPASPDLIRVDRDHLFLHTPGFSAWDRLRDVQSGVRALVRRVLELMAERAADRRRSEEARR